MNLDHHIIAFANKHFAGRDLRIDYEISPAAEIGPAGREDLILYFDDAVEEINCLATQFGYVSAIIGLNEVNEDCLNFIQSFFVLLNEHHVFNKIFHPLKPPSFEKSLSFKKYDDNIHVQHKYFMVARPSLYRMEHPNKRKYPELRLLDIQISFPFMFTADSELKCVPVLSLFYNTPHAIRLVINIQDKTVHPLINGSTHYAELFENNPVMAPDYIDKWCHRYLDDILCSFTPDFDTSVSINQKLTLAEMSLI